MATLVISLLLSAQAPDAQAKEDQARLISMVVLSMADPEQNNRAKNAKVLGDLGFTNDEAVAALTKALSDVAGRVRSEAVRALGRIGPDAKSSVPTLIKLYKVEVDASIRPEIISTLGVMAPVSKDAMNWLITLARSPGADMNDTNRLDAIKALGRLGSDAKPAVPALITMLNSSASSPKDWANVYEACAAALTKIGDTRAVEPFSRHRKGQGVKGTQPDRIVGAADKAAREFERIARGL